MRAERKRGNHFTESLQNSQIIGLESSHESTVLRLVGPVEDGLDAAGPAFGHRERKCDSVSLSLYLSDRELPNANSEPIELGMVLNEGEDRKTLLRRGRPLRRCFVLEI